MELEDSLYPLLREVREGASMQLMRSRWRLGLGSVVVVVVGCGLGGRDRRRRARLWSLRTRSTRCCEVRGLQQMQIVWCSDVRQWCGVGLGMRAGMGKGQGCCRQGAREGKD